MKTRVLSFNDGDMFITVDEEGNVVHAEEFLIAKQQYITVTDLIHQRISFWGPHIALKLKDMEEAS